MIINSYCYETSDGVSGTFGPQDIAVVAEWCIWKNSLRQDTSAFLDMPGAGECRIVLLSLPDCGRIMFSVPGTFFSTGEAVCRFYRALITAQPEKLRDALQNNTAFELACCDSPGMEPPPLPTSFEDLDGLQFIGSTEKSLSTVARMLSCQTDTWIRTFFLAVNPAAYHNKFTTIISDETPEGEWLKQTSTPGNQTEHAQSKLKKQFRKIFTRQRLIPAVILLLLFLGLAGTLFFTQRQLNRTRHSLHQKENEIRALRFRLKSQEDKIRILETRQETNASKSR